MAAMFVATAASAHSGFTINVMGLPLEITRLAIERGTARRTTVSIDLD